MPIESREVGDVLILDVFGRLTLGEGSGGLRDAIKEAAAQGKKKVLLRMADTVYVDSSGLAEMISGFTALANQGASLKLLAPSKRMVDILQINQLYTVFEVFENEQEAIQSFS